MVERHGWGRYEGERGTSRRGRTEGISLMVEMLKSSQLRRLRMSHQKWLLMPRGALVTRRTRAGVGLEEERYSRREEVGAAIGWKLSKLTSVKEGYWTAGAGSNSGRTKS
jgi:hypothetical protein